jgi:hypothetical protein
VAKTRPMADSRDMFVVHDMFRREFKAIPGLVSEVPEGDGAQVTIVADHVVWMVTFLHAHHHGEDLFIWPKLLERVPVKIDPLIFTMTGARPPPYRSGTLWPVRRLTCSC